MGGNRVQDVGTPILGTDATNKAYVDKGLNKAYEGTAIALAISQPVFLPGQTFAVRGGWGDYEGQNAFAGAGFTSTMTSTSCSPPPSNTPLTGLTSW